jgi:hypothetical protein
MCQRHPVIADCAATLIRGELFGCYRVTRAVGGTAMKLIGEYLEHALSFERLAAEEQ